MGFSLLVRCRGRTGAFAGYRAPRAHAWAWRPGRPAWLARWARAALALTKMPCGHRWEHYRLDGQRCLVCSNARVVELHREAMTAGVPCWRWFLGREG